MLPELTLPLKNVHSTKFGQKVLGLYGQLTFKIVMVMKWVGAFFRLDPAASCQSFTMFCWMRTIIWFKKVCSGNFLTLQWWLEGFKCTVSSNALKIMQFIETSTIWRRSIQCNKAGIELLKMLRELHWYDIVLQNGKNC